MNKKIFYAEFFTSLLVLIISFVLIFGVLFDYFEDQIFNELKSEAFYISCGPINEDSYINNFKDSKKRITLVAPDGTVLADTSADAESLDNHGERKEISEALKNGSGKSSRYSNTLMQKTLYYAIKLENGNILRVSTTQNSVVTILLGLLHPIIFVIITALIISLLLSHKVSGSIIKPINNLDLENPESNVTYEELTPLLSKLSAQKKIIQRQIKQANQKQEEFKLITENMNEGLLIIDNAENVLSYNQAAVRLLEIKEMKNSSVLTFNRTKGFRSVIKKALLGESAESSITVDEQTYSLIANPVYEDERIIGAVIVIIDVTERVKREQLRREFTSNVSHELKTPLTSISGFAEIMKSGGTPDETVVDFSSSIYDEAQRLISLVNDIIKISELDENQIHFEKQPIDLYKLSENVIKSLKPAAEKHKVELNLIGNTANVLGTEKILNEMIYNLCDNSVKYNKENGTVDIIISTSENKATLTVRDTGIGIPASSQKRVFERFYRVDKSRSKLVGGTGLGLSIVKHAALFHNADINLESCEGKGTTVTVTFDLYI